MVWGSGGRFDRRWSVEGAFRGQLLDTGGHRAITLVQVVTKLIGDLTERGSREPEIA